MDAKQRYPISATICLVFTYEMLFLYGHFFVSVYVLQQYIRGTTYVCIKEDSFKTMYIVL